MSNEVIQNTNLSEIKLENIILDERYQVRKNTKKSLIALYIKKLEAGEKFPPLIVSIVNQKIYLIDGFHRYKAYKKAGIESCEVEYCQSPDLRLTAMKKNLEHGQPLTQLEKRELGLEYIKKNPDLTSRDLGKLTGLSHAYISKLKKRPSVGSPTDLVKETDTKNISDPAKDENVLPTDFMLKMNRLSGSHVLFDEKDRPLKLESGNVYISFQLPTYLWDNLRQPLRKLVQDFIKSHSNCSQSPDMVQPK